MTPELVNELTSINSYVRAARERAHKSRHWLVIVDLTHAANKLETLIASQIGYGLAAVKAEGEPVLYDAHYRHVQAHVGIQVKRSTRRLKKLLRTPSVLEKKPKRRKARKGK